jgi:shikimate dehydrogenase
MRCQVLGDPIAHSLSPVLHRAGYAAVGLGWEFDAVQVAAGGLASYVASCGDDWRGFSVTMPLKREALEYADASSDVARLAGVANTLVNDGATVYAENTDVPGAVAAIRERYDGHVDGATILGGGATATSVGLALADLGCRSISLLVRTPDRATETLAALERHPAAPSVVVAGLTASVEGDIVVSTIPAEAQTSTLVEACADIPVVFDVLYHPWPTPLAAAAAADGRVVVNGLDLLAHQAQLQFELFTGREVGVDVLRDAGLAELARR